MTLNQTARHLLYHQTTANKEHGYTRMARTAPHKGVETNRTLLNKVIDLKQKSLYSDADSLEKKKHQNRGSLCTTKISH